MPGRARGSLVLSEDERQTLTRWARRAKSSQALASRARIVLACADGLPNTHVAARLGVSRDMVGKWRSRFIARRLEGLSDEPRPGAPRKLSDEAVEAVVVRTLEEPPPRGDTHWWTRGNCRPIRSSSRRSGTSSGCTSTRVRRAALTIRVEVRDLHR